jgi:hypothetical protein
MAQSETWDAQPVHDELERVRADFHRLLDTATREDLTRASDGTRWNNEQLLFHMLFGYMILWALLGLARVFGRLPQGASRSYARLLNAATKAFDLANFLGSRAGARVYNHTRMAAKLDRVIASLHQRVDHETARNLARGMHYPTRWDPFFTGYMTLADVYRLPTKHYDFHRRQLTLAPES